METSTAIVVSAVLATLGWLYSGRIQLIVSRKRHTFDVFSRYRDDKKHEAAIDDVRKIIRRHRRQKGIDGIGSVVPVEYNDCSEEERDSINLCLDKFEEIAVSILQGDIDEGFAFNLENTKIIKFAETFLPFIEAQREAFAQPSYCSNLLLLAERWRGDFNRTITHRVYEFVFLRPMLPSHFKPSNERRVATPPKRKI